MRVSVCSGSGCSSRGRWCRQEGAAVVRGKQHVPAWWHAAAYVGLMRACAMDAEVAGFGWAALLAVAARHGVHSAVPLGRAGLLQRHVGRGTGAGHMHVLRHLMSQPLLALMRHAVRVSVCSGSGCSSWGRWCRQEGAAVVRG